MLRTCIVIPLFLSTLTLPASGEVPTSYCSTSPWTMSRCEAERARLALSTTHCKTAGSTAPRCLAERARSFAQARNAEINASLARVAQIRAFERVRNAEIDASMAAVKTERARTFAQARNAEINASLARVAHIRTFERARNAEIDASMAAVAAERARTFAQARNAEINASMARVRAGRERVFAAARNAEIRASMARVQAVRAFELARNAEIDASIAAVAAERTRQFAAARNAEIRASMAAYEAQRVLRAARARMAMFDRPLGMGRQSASPMETGAIGNVVTPTLPTRGQTSSQTLYAEPCSQANQPIEPLHFTASSTQIGDDMKPALDRLALIANECPGVRIKIHGYSDASGPAHVNRRMAVRRAQAARSYLIAAGIASNRIAAIGHGIPGAMASEAGDGNLAETGHIEISVTDLTIDASAARIMWELAEALDPSYVPPLARLSP